MDTGGTPNSCSLSEQILRKLTSKSKLAKPSSDRYKRVIIGVNCYVPLLDRLEDMLETPELGLSTMWQPDM